MPPGFEPVLTETKSSTALQLYSSTALQLYSSTNPAQFELDLIIHSLLLQATTAEIFIEISSGANFDASVHK